MYKLITGISLILFSLFNSGDSAVATFTGDFGITGTVTVNNGHIDVDIDVSSLTKADMPGGADCFDGGLKYHIHEMWSYGSGDPTERETSACGSAFTGGHWDPWLGCGSASGNDYCIPTSDVTNMTCVPGSSNWKGGDLGYKCSSDNFTSNPYVCEVGDWSGKYGLVMEADTDVYQASVSSAYEVDGTDLTDKAVVFHCGGGTNAGDRAFCAPFLSTDTEDSTTYSARPTQGGDSYEAVFSDLGASAVLLNSDGTYDITIDYSSLTPTGCPTDILEYRIYDEFAVGCSAGDFYDPTVSCAVDSMSDYCGLSGLQRCDDDSYEYICDSDDRFECAVTDLSGKYGTINTADAETFTIEGTDDIMIDLSQLAGKSLVLACEDGAVIACAQWEVQSTGDDDDDDDVSTTEAGDDDDDDDDTTSNAIRYGFGISLLAVMIAQFV